MKIIKLDFEIYHKGRTFHRNSMISKLEIVTHARTGDPKLRAFVQQLLLLQQWRIVLSLKPKWHPKQLSPEQYKDISQSICVFQHSNFVLKLGSLPGFGHFEQHLLPAPALQPPSHPHFGWR